MKLACECQALRLLSSESCSLESDRKSSRPLQLQQGKKLLNDMQQVLVLALKKKWHFVLRKQLKRRNCSSILFIEYQDEHNCRSSIHYPEWVLTQRGETRVRRKDTSDDHFSSFCHLCSKTSFSFCELFLLPLHE